MKQQIKKLAKKLQGRNQELAPEKCKLVILNKQNIRREISSILINNVRITSSLYAKFLGVMLDEKIVIESTCK